MSVTSPLRRSRTLALGIEDHVYRFCARHSLTVLRVALGAIFVLFGALKFFPDLSPAQAVAEMTTQKLTFGLVPVQTLLHVVAIVEVLVGLLLISNWAMRFALWLLALEMLAILSPLVLLTGELFSGPHHLPSLLGQYILKDFVLLGAVLVLFAAQRYALVAKPAATQTPQAPRNLTTTTASPSATRTATRGRYTATPRHTASTDQIR